MISKGYSKLGVTFGYLALLGLLLQPTFSASALDPEKSFSQLQLDVWQATEGLPLGSVVEILQTSDGYLWLGGYEELVRFDGERFVVVAGAAELGGNNTYALAEGADGSLWIGTDGGGVTRYLGGRFTTYGLQEGLAHDQVRSLLVDSRGDLWIGTFGGGLIRFDGKRFTTFSEDDGVPGRFVWALVEDRHGDLWIGTEKGLTRFSGSHPTTYGPEHGLPEARITALLEDRQGGLWLGTSGGSLAHFDGATFTPVDAAQDLDRDITSLLEDRHGTLWIGTHGHGLYRLRGDEFTVHSLADGLSSDVAWSIIEDREGSLWIGTEGGGLNRLRETRFTPMTTRHGLPHDRVWVVDSDASGALWVGSDGGGLSRVDDGAVVSYTLDKGLSSNNVTAIHIESNGGVWVGTDRGLHRLENGRLPLQFPELLGPEIVVLAIHRDRRGDLWVGSEVAGLHRITGIDGPTPESTTFSEVDGLLINAVKALFEDRAGDLWIGTDVGLVRWHQGKLSADPSINLVRSIHEDSQGTLWVTTRGHGLVRLGKDRKTPQFLTTHHGLPTDAMYYFLEDGLGHVWLSSNQGIFRILKADLEAVAQGTLDRVQPEIYGIADGMRSLECTGGSQPAGTATTDGHLWFPTVRGLVEIDPESLNTNPVPPPVHIESVWVNGDPLDIRGASPGSPLRFDIPPGVRDLELRYTALSLVDPTRVQFKVRLEGHDPRWIDQGPRRFVHYTNMKPGDYRFQVIAANNDGVWNTSGAQLELRLQPAFHQTRTFWGLCAVALGLLGWTIHRFLVRRLVDTVQELRRVQDELETKNREIAQKHAEMERFSYTVSHDLKSPLVTIRGYVGLLQKGLTSGKTHRAQEDLGRIDRAAAQMGQLLDDLLELSRIGRVVRPPQDIDAQGLVQQTLDLLEGKLAERSIAVTVAPNLGNLYGDSTRLEQVFQNLIENAIKYMGDTQEPQIHIGRRDTHNDRAFFVRDNGIGIDPQFHDRVFGLFDQLSTGSEGTGIGLALVKRIIDAHRGHIWVESEGKGYGSTFLFTLPEAPESKDQ